MSEEGKKKTTLSRILNILKRIVIGLVSFIFIAILLILLIRGIGKAVNNKTPEGGINENKYIKINNSTQWISIYGKDKSNPVILYLHGGPGGFTSYIDYKILRKFSDVYTVVSWDQRDVGLSAKNNEDTKDVPYTKELFMTDALELTKYLKEYLQKEKIALLGHSWGTMLGSNLALEHPEHYLHYIGTGQVIDARKTEEDLIKAAKIWSKDDDKEIQELVAKMDLTLSTLEASKARSKVLRIYGYDALAEKPDFSIASAIFFNPYYSLSDLYRLIKSFSTEKTKKSKCDEFISSPEFDKFSLLNRTAEYQIPYYNINGDHDYQANTFQAEEYYNIVKAPRKKLYIMENMNHGTPLRSNEFSEKVHEIAKLEQDANLEQTQTGNSTVTHVN